MIVSTITHAWTRTIIHYHQLSPTIMQFEHVQIRHDSFVRLNERMIVHDSFSVSGGNQGGLNAIWLPHCHRPVKNNKAIIWTNIRTTVTLKARKWEKRKSQKKTRLREVECYFKENEAQLCLWKIPQWDVNGNNTALKFNVREGIASVSKKILGSDASTLRDFDKLSWTIMDRLIANMIVNDSEW